MQHHVSCYENLLHPNHTQYRNEVEFEYSYAEQGNGEMNFFVPSQTVFLMIPEYFPIVMF